MPPDHEQRPALTAVLDRAVDARRRLPELPFRLRGGELRLTDFDWVLGTGVVPTLRGIADDHGDRELVMVVLDPPPSELAAEGQPFAQACLPLSDLEPAYWRALTAEVHHEPGFQVRDLANVVAIVGDSGRWAVWAERAWSLTLIHTTAPAGRWWIEEGPFASVALALENLTYAFSSYDPAAPANRAFLRNLDTFGADVRHTVDV